MEFVSETTPGLELVDIVTNAVRRALRDSLRRDGWLPIRTLMIHRREQYVQVISLARSDLVLPPRAIRVLGEFFKGGRNLFAPRFAD
jgi:hypothetical protein